MEDHVLCIRLTFKFLKFVAFWRDENETRLYQCFRVVFFVIFFLLYLGTILAGLLVTNTIDQFFSEALYISLTEISMAVKAYSLFKHFYTVLQLHQLAVSKEFQSIGEEELHLVRVLLWRFNTCYTIFQALVLTINVSAISLLFDGQYKLPYFSWIWGLPYGVDAPYTYLFIWFYQVFGMCIHGILAIAVESQASYLLTVAGAQLDFLSRRFSQLTCSHGSTDENSKHRKSFIQFVQHYNKVYWFVRDTEDVYSKPMFAQFCASAISLCATAYRLSLVHVKDFSLVIASSLYLCALLYQIFLQCYFSNEVTLKSDRLTHALYSSEWYNLIPRNSKEVEMMMIRTQQPIRVKAGGIIYCDLKSLMSVWTRNAFRL
ncbi:odorant receptor 94a-like [Wyeomyia smithii]|uniref:odorant receptor 94a-like n=1 Tax=Wyeomyia smithii TaxID=174621 RepID=UPI0024681169|nr:odorant receptor 94a-like [Wyeomyia smithii]